MKSKTLFNLDSHKGALSYDAQGENKYIIRARMTKAKFREILKHFYFILLQLCSKRVYENFKLAKVCGIKKNI